MLLGPSPTDLPHMAASQRPAATALVARLGEAGVDLPQPAASAAVPDAALPRPVQARPSPIDPARAIEPLSSIEALVDVAVSVIETGEPADDVERVVDAVGRLPRDRPDALQASDGHDRQAGSDHPGPA